MPIAITKYKCSICNTEYNHFWEASNCEALGLPINDNIVEGQSLVFEDESTMFGSSYSYSTGEGIVLHKQVVLQTDASGLKTHGFFYIVNSRFGECGVALAENEFGRKLASLAEWKYTNGFANQLK